MPVRNADARWEGDLPNGKGTMRLGGGAFEGQYSFSSRFEDGAGTNPEELIGAALAYMGHPAVTWAERRRVPRTLGTLLVVIVILLIVYRSPLLAMVPLVTIAL